MIRWLPLVALALAQFVMVLDQAVMNVSISRLVEEYEEAQLQALRTGLLVAAIVALVALTFTRDLPHRHAEPGQPPLAEDPEPEADSEPA